MTDTRAPTRSDWGETFGNVCHLLSECGDAGKNIPGGSVWILLPRLVYDQSSLMVASVQKVKLFVGYAGILPHGDSSSLIRSDKCRENTNALSVTASVYLVVALRATRTHQRSTKRSVIGCVYSGLA
ncbi:hypothetical protein JOB18_029209 [Solea senegalensis]|uniref:Uncharacterized protein n=1 Tax=Solea senegalensis TaxID=28829 RepID=A0AAV6QE80_SOLSE|nr:hypothetical protein JOB18_029209 [Solea senegalensis]